MTIIIVFSPDVNAGQPPMDQPQSSLLNSLVSVTKKALKPVGIQGFGNSCWFALFNAPNSSPSPAMPDSNTKTKTASTLRLLRRLWSCRSGIRELWTACVFSIVEGTYQQTVRSPVQAS
jgi:hypothetical protein